VQTPHLPFAPPDFLVYSSCIPSVHHNMPFATDPLYTHPVRN
jgi:hypothetical protein